MGFKRSEQGTVVGGDVREVGNGVIKGLVDWVVRTSALTLDEV